MTRTQAADFAVLWAGGTRTGAGSGGSSGGSSSAIGLLMNRSTANEPLLTSISVLPADLGRLLSQMSLGARNTGDAATEAELHSRRKADYIKGEAKG